MLGRLVENSRISPPQRLIAITDLHCAPEKFGLFKMQAAQMHAQSSHMIGGQVCASPSAKRCEKVVRNLNSNAVYIV